MRVLFIISTDDAETMYNALRMANVGIQKGDEISVFMLGKAVTTNHWVEKTLMLLPRSNSLLKKVISTSEESACRPTV